MNDFDKELAARKKAGLPPYHSIDQSDVGFRFTEPVHPNPGLTAFIAGDFSAMEDAWHDKDDVKGCCTIRPIEPQPLEELPTVETIFDTPSGYLAWLACDGNYFAQFGAKLLASIEGPSHVHLMDADPDYAKEVIAYLGRPIGLTVEQPKAAIPYYHAIRFCRFAQMLKARHEPVVLLDVNTIANRPISDLPEVPVGMRIRPARIEPWQQCDASVVIGTREGQAYFDAVADYIFYFWKQKKLRQSIDQTALYFVWKRLSTQVHALNEREVDYEFKSDGIIWRNDSKAKWAGSDPNREKFDKKFAAIKIPSATAAAQVKREQTLEKIAYLSCELTSRDLESRILIAKHLHDQNIPVVIGPVWNIFGNLGRIRRGAILFATSNDVQAKVMQKASNTGNFVVASDSEGLPLVDPRQNVSDIAVSVCDQFLVDSQAHKDIFVETYGGNKFRVTGSPRLECLVGSDIKPEAGPTYVLFNTGFGIINSVWGDANEALQVMKRAMEISKEHAELLIEVETLTFKMMVPLIKWLAPQMRVVIRPHPSENADKWVNLSPHVEVVKKSAPYPWIKGAEVVVHGNSTTGLEAAALGTPALNLNPHQPWGSKFVIKNYNYTAHTIEQAQEALAAFLTSKSGPIADHASGQIDLGLRGAENTAAYLAEVLKEAKPMTGKFMWTHFPRTEKQRDKFSATLGDVQKILDRFNLSQSIQKLEDSTFCMWPTSPK